MQTRLQMVNSVKSNLADVTGIYFDTVHVLNAIQDGYNEIITETECVEKVQENISWASSQVYYDLHSKLTAPNYWKPVRFFNHATNRWIPIVDSRFLDKFRWDWEICFGTPWFAYVVNWQFVAFFPHYPGIIGSTNSTFDLFYKVAPIDLVSDDQLIEIPDPYATALENWATADLLDAVQEFAKSADYWADANEQVAQLKLHVKRRMSPAFYAQLNDLQFPYPTLP